MFQWLFPEKMLSWLLFRGRKTLNMQNSGLKKRNVHHA
jgi:hypothetical protein